MSSYEINLGWHMNMDFLSMLMVFGVQLGRETQHRLTKKHRKHLEKRMPLPLPLPYPTWTFARHQSPSYQTYSDVKHTNRKPAIKSTILDGQTLDLSLPGHVYKRKTRFFGNLIFSSLAKSHHTSGIKSCASLDGFNAGLDRF